MSDKNIKHLVEVDTHYPFHTSFTDDKKTDVKHGNYTLSISNADKHNMQKEGRAKLISSPNQDKMKHLEQHNALSTKMGTTTHIKVKNNKTGETSDHHVFQSNAGNKSLTSVSALNSPRKENEHNNVIHSFLSGKELTEMFTFKGFLEEKKLTPEEKRKREEIALAIEKDNPDMPIDKKMAIATATAKRVYESTESTNFTHKVIHKEYGKKVRGYGSPSFKFTHQLVDSDNNFHEVSAKKYSSLDLDDKTPEEHKTEYIKHLITKKAGNNFGKQVDLNSKLRGKPFNVQLKHLLSEDVENVEEAKIDIYVDGKYHVSTTQSKTNKEAREKYLKAYPQNANKNIKLQRVKENVDELSLEEAITGILHKKDPRQSLPMDGKVDKRYTTTKEFTGKFKPEYVVRFQGERIGSHETEAGAKQIAQKYADEREKVLLGMSESVNLEEAIHPLDAHEILMKHGGRDADYHTLNYKQIESLDDEAKERGYKHNSLTGKSRPRAFHDQLTRIADRYVNKDGSFKPEMKDELKESLNNFYTNNKTGKSGQILSKNDTHTTIKYDNNRTEQVPNDKFEQTHTRIIH